MLPKLLRKRLGRETENQMVRVASHGKLPEKSLVPVLYQGVTSVVPAQTLLSDGSLRETLGSCAKRSAPLRAASAFDGHLDTGVAFRSAMIMRTSLEDQAQKRFRSSVRRVRRALSSIQRRFPSLSQSRSEESWLRCRIKLLRRNVVMSRRGLGH
jgi:DNA-binding TFAR19-related protein (PDSD5 family)